jgi:Ca2+/H+ antiporter
VSQISNILDFIWPHVGKMPDDETLNDDLAYIDTVSWGGDAATLLEEARRLRDTETARQMSAETKSQIFLAALLALIPVLVSLTEHDAFKEVLKSSYWYAITAFGMFILGIAYGVGAFVSSFRALSVRGYHRVDLDEFVAGSKKVNPVEYLAKEILKSVRSDRSNINHKIGYVIVTHQLLFRMAGALLLALTLVVLVPKFGSISEAIKQEFSSQEKCPGFCV